jgi:hypothetical protein
MEYHLNKHGKGRTIEQYTEDAMTFYNKNKSSGSVVTLKDGTQGIKLGNSDIGGYWTIDGKLVSFWD